MVDSISAKPVSAPGRTSAVERSTPIAPAPQPQAPVRAADAASASAEAARAPAAGLQAVAGEIARQAPVDETRVARIRTAIANGTYPLSPENVADRLIALKLNWIPHESS